MFFHTVRISDKIDSEVFSFYKSHHHQQQTGEQVREEQTLVGRLEVGASRLHRVAAADARVLVGVDFD